jgi:hypothetical protein
MYKEKRKPTYDDFALKNGRNFFFRLADTFVYIIKKEKRRKNYLLS